MKKWYQWFYLSLAFFACGIVNYFSGRSILAAVLQVSVTFILGFLQFLCDQKGDTGKKVFKYICIAVSALLAIWILYMLISLLV